MWVFVLSRKITGAFTVEQELNALNADFPKNVFKHVGKTRALVMVPVDDCEIEEIQLLVNNPRLVPGGASLVWFQEDLREDILRTIEENEVKEKSTDDLKAEAMRGLADLLDSMGQLRGFASRMPEGLKQQMRDHAKKCTDPDCGVNRILAEDDKGEKADAAPTGGGPFQVGDIVRVRKWEGRVNGITWQTNDGGRNMADSLGNEYPITKIERGDGRVNNWWIPLTQLDLVRRPSSEPAPAAFKTGDKVTIVSGFDSDHLVFRDDMKPLVGKQGVVVRVSKSGNYAVKVDGDNTAWSWPASSLVLTEPAPAAAPDSPQ